VLFLTLLSAWYKNLTLALLSLFTLSARVRSIRKEEQSMAAINSSERDASIGITVFTFAKHIVHL
jgi:hypothetical protein